MIIGYKKFNKINFCITTNPNLIIKQQKTVVF